MEKKRLFLFLRTSCQRQVWLTILSLAFLIRCDGWEHGHIPNFLSAELSEGRNGAKRLQHCDTSRALISHLFFFFSFSFGFVSLHSGLVYRNWLAGSVRQRFAFDAQKGAMNAKVAAPALASFRPHRPNVSKTSRRTVLITTLPNLLSLTCVRNVWMGQLNLRKTPAGDAIYRSNSVRCKVWALDVGGCRGPKLKRRMLHYWQDVFGLGCAGKRKWNTSERQSKESERINALIVAARSMGAKVGCQLFAPLSFPIAFGGCVERRMQPRELPNQMYGDIIAKEENWKKEQKRLCGGHGRVFLHAKRSWTA